MERILYFGMTDNLGGIESFIINYYRELDKNKYQFDFINIYDNNLCFQDEIKNMGGHIFKVTSYYKNPFIYVREVIDIIKKYKYKIVHCNMNSAVFLYPLIASKIGGVDIIISHAHNASSDKGFLKEMLHSINKHFIPLLANRYVACSQKAGKWFYSNKIIASKNYHIINNAIDIDKFKFNPTDREIIRKELNIDENVLVIGHVGRFNKQKNHKFIIDIFEKICFEEPDSKLLLIGVGPLMDDVKKIVKIKKIENNVIFLGRKNNVQKYMSAMDVFVLPSLYEGLPLVGVEAQASGLRCFFSSNITNELNLTENIQYLDIQDKNLWCNEILNSTKEKVDRGKVLLKKFDVKNEINVLLELYTIKEDYSNEETKN